MATLLYSPGVRVVIQTAGHGIIDVSEDISSGNLVLTENQPSSFSFTLANHRRKYDGIFTPNDTISVQMKRVRWMPVFAGYLDEVPYYSVYPRNIELRATDTLKRLKYRLWDPGAQESVALINRALDQGGSGTSPDGGMSDVVMATMTKVGNWPQRKIHIGRLPDEWSERMEPLRKRVMREVALGPGRAGVSKGKKAGEAGSKAKPPGRRPENTGQGPQTSFRVLSTTTGVLPTTYGKATVFGGQGTPGEASITGESLAQPLDQWYCAMRWPYSPDGVVASGGTSQADYDASEEWWGEQRILVTNPKNMKAVVLRPAHWGPADGTDIAMSEHALFTVLGARANDSLDIKFAPDRANLGSYQSEPQTLEGTTQGAVGASSLVSSRPLFSARTAAGGEGGAGGGSAPGGTSNTSKAEIAKNEILRLPWRAGDNLKPNVHAARAFIKDNFNVETIYGYSYRYIAGTNTLSNHAKGLALDFMVYGDRKKGNAIAKWFVDNPNVFGVTEIIWYDKIITASRASEGWRTYGDPGSSNATQQHRDHPHISFSENKSSPGKMGNGWNDRGHSYTGGFDIGDGYVPGGDTGGGIPSTGSDASLINTFDWYPTASVESTVLTGYRALMNDVPLLSSIERYVGASMRSFMAGPNGDFISWFPDYFGTYGTAARMVINDIEIAGDGFTMVWDDSRMVTHQFVSGSPTGHSTGTEPNGGAIDLFWRARTQGIASVEFPELMKALFNLPEDAVEAGGFLSPKTILKRFGARMNYRSMGMISSPEAEFWYACRLFQLNWASQFSSQVRLTFMPEIWPGMLIRLNTFGFQAYVEQVTHSWDYGVGGMSGGFKTSVRVIAPSSTKGGGLYGLPVAGGQ